MLTNHLKVAISGALVSLFLLSTSASATPQFARGYKVDCTHCHSLPPRLNERGLAFVAAGYRFLEAEGTRSRTIPLAIWNTLDAEWRHSADLAKSFPSRVEIISAGPLGATRASYFAELRALSQSLMSNGRLMNRSGRFEDLLVKVPVAMEGALAVTAGQFRALSQVDVSLRLGLAEPLAFSSSVPSAVRASNARRTGLRAFSASGRQPALRLEYQPGATGASADGWFASATLPLAGELTLGLTDAASFEFEARPKGIFVETYRRWGLTTLGGHAFAGDQRRLASVVATHNITPRVSLLGAIGRFNAAAATDTRFSLGSEVTVSRYAAAGIRVDHRTEQRLDPVVLLYGNGHLPFGPAAFRQALRLQIEQRVQPRNHATTVAVSHIF